MYIYVRLLDVRSALRHTVSKPTAVHISVRAKYQRKERSSKVVENGRTESDHSTNILAVTQAIVAKAGLGERGIEAFRTALLRV
jgi:hypothetical protein